MAAYNFTNPAASATDAILQELLRQRMESRQAMLDSLTTQKVQAELENQKLTAQALADQRNALAQQRQQAQAEGAAQKVFGALQIGDEVSPEDQQTLKNAGYGDYFKTETTTPPADEMNLTPEPVTKTSFLGTQDQRQLQRLKNWAQNQPQDVQNKVLLGIQLGAKPDEIYKSIETAPKDANVVQAENLFNPANNHAVYFKGGKYFDSETNEPVPSPSHYKAPATGEAQQNAANNRLDRSYQYNDTVLEKTAKPIEDQVARLGRLQTTINKQSPQADALVAPELLTVMAGGQGSGLRMNEAEISRIVGGRSNLEGLKAALNKWSLDPTQALSITPEQRKEMWDLVTEVSKKAHDQLSAIDQARSDLIGQTDVNGHRKVVADLKKKLNDVNSTDYSTTTPPPAGSKYKVTIQ